MKEQKNANEIPKLTELDLKIMGVLWEKGRELTIQEITSFLEKEKLSVASVTQAVNKLVKKKAVEVKQHVLVSNVYARTFLPCFGREEFMAAEYGRLQKSVFGTGPVSRLGIVAALLGAEDDSTLSWEEVRQLQQIIDRKKEKLLEEEQKARN